MRIVFINQFFWPDAAATSQLLTDVVRFLSSQGHEVEVVCGIGSYAGPGGVNGDEAPDAVVHRVSSAPFARGPAARMWSYLSFFFGAFRAGLRIPPADVVVTMTTPPMLPVLGALLGLVRHKRHYIWEMDLFPEALTGVGLLRPNSWIVGLLGALADFARKRSDGVIAIGDCMRRRLIERGIDPSKIHVAENWADSREIQPVEPESDGPLKILYSGNLGLTHDIETIRDAMTTLKNEPQFSFRFVGAGPRREAMAEYCRSNELSNVGFAPYCRRGEMRWNLGWGDIGLITQLSSCLGTVVPSKIYGLMAAGRPVLYIGPENSAPADIIRRFDCGWQFECGDAAGVVDLLRRLEANRAVARAAGRRAHQAFLEHYDLPQSVARISEILGVPAAVPAARAAVASR